MYFSDSYELRQLEKLMRAIPNFRSRGHGVMILHRYEYTERDCDCLACPHFISRKRGCGADKCPCIGERITAGAATLKETVAETMAAIKYPPFVERLIQYLKESEGNPMYFRNEKHRTVFTEAVAKLDKKDYALMAAVYLLTADCRLWSITGRYVQRNEILFENIHLKGSTANGYTLYCTAKDLYLGTKNLTIGDLADTTIIEPKIFGVICNAMAIRRYGLGAVKFKERTNNQKKAFTDMVIKLKANQADLLGTLIRQIEAMQDRTSRNQERIRQIDKEIADLGAKNLVITRLHTSGVLDAADYAKQTSEIGNRITDLRIERRKKLTEDEDDILLDTLKALNGILEEYEPTAEFDNDLFEQIVQDITVNDNTQITFRLLGDIQLTEKINEKGRCKSA